MVRKIGFKNYKAFRSKQELDIGPITVLIGKNSSGKSAISKLLTLISASLTGDFDQPLKWENQGVKIGASNSDLVYNKAVTTSLLEFNISNGSTTEVDLVVAVDRKDKTSIVEWSKNAQNVEAEKTIFKGFLPNGIKIEDLFLNYDYIGPIRELPEANYPNSFEKFNSIGITGLNAYPILIQDSENGGALLSKVSDWYKSNFEGWKIEVVALNAPVPTFQVTLSNEQITQINIVNVGQGMNQALPLIVRSYLDVDIETTIIIEEPETHLHPAAHGNLAERFVDSYLENNNRRYFVETHSQNFLLRLRRLVAQGKLLSEELVIYYVDFDEELNESSIKRINVKPDGSVDWWPDGIFAETLVETRAINNVTTSNSKNVD